MVFGRIDGHKISKVVDDDIGTDVSVLVGRRAREGVDADAATSVRRLEVLSDRFDGSKGRHAVVGLLADSAGPDEFLDDLQMDAVARIHAVKIGFRLSDTTVFAVVDMGLTEALGHVRQDREMVDGAEEQSIPFEGSMAGDVVGSLRIPERRVGRRGSVVGVRGDQVKEVHPGEHVGEDIGFARDVLDLGDETLEEQAPADDNGGIGLLDPNEIGVISFNDERLAFEVVRQFLDSEVDGVGLLFRNIPAHPCAAELGGNESNDLVFRFAARGSRWDELEKGTAASLDGRVAAESPRE